MVALQYVFHVALLHTHCPCGEIWLHHSYFDKAQLYQLYQDYLMLFRT